MPHAELNPKKKLRRAVIERRNQLSKAEIEQKSSAIAERLYSLSAYRKAAIVMFFISFGSEVITRCMVEETINRGKRPLAPKPVPENREIIPSEIIDWDKDLVPGAYKILEPAEKALRPVHPREIDLLIVPGVAFDSRGNRLGYGGGYYDRFFARLRADVLLAAIAFELQVVPRVPVDRWDRPVDCIITENRVIEANPGRL